MKTMAIASRIYWQAKIWGLLHDSPLKALQRSKGGEGPWDCLDVMTDWNKKATKEGDIIASASDRAAIGALKDSWSYVNYDLTHGLELRHLLSGASLGIHFKDNAKLQNWQKLSNTQEVAEIKEFVTNKIPETIRKSNDAKKVFWYLWRCLPEVLSRSSEFNDQRVFLLPAETRIPDCSIWSHNSTTAAFSGALSLKLVDGHDAKSSQPYLVTLTFNPVQELVKHSRKMQDFWASSWILHYLSAAISWEWAQEYGPDIFVYPSLYGQPLVDLWLLKEYPEFSDFKDSQGKPLIKDPSLRQLLTAGFSNVLVAILPQNKIQAAINRAKFILTGDQGSWMKLAEKVKKNVFGDISIAESTWENHLKSQWQIYWTALPFGDPSDPRSPFERKDDSSFDLEAWKERQNELAGLLRKENKLFTPAEKAFFGNQVNIGSWWPAFIDRLRMSAKSIKNARSWELPTAFGDRSSISGIGMVVRPAVSHPDRKHQEWDWAEDQLLKEFWQNSRGLFNGTERLNATEVVKRGLERVFHSILGIPKDEKIGSYPDLTAGVAGWLTQDEANSAKYEQACKEIRDRFPWSVNTSHQSWGIPWIEKNLPQSSHSRLLNAGWLIEDFKLVSPNLTEEEFQAEKVLLTELLDHLFPGNNPTSWYVFAMGDGDSMSQWLNGSKMDNYRQYVPENFPLQPPPPDVKIKLDAFLEQKKRMGPATHSALSRSLLDFSNQLVPYLTEQRYAGRLIYSGGDDVLAYTNLWEWDDWLWDIRRCFQGEEDPRQEFNNQGDYWRWQAGKLPENLADRPLFTLGSKATISFGIVIANQGVPLAIALENLRAAEKAAKAHEYLSDGENKPKNKDAVQVRVLYQNGNILKATAKFDTFNLWRSLLNNTDQDPSLFEQAAEIWKQHPAPCEEAITPWTKGFCSRRDALKNDSNNAFQTDLEAFLKALYQTTKPDSQTAEITNWLKLAAFVLRKRKIGVSEMTVGGEP